jgi:two-component system cell cycle response regulator DivK
MTNILVAEDNPVDRELLRELLEARGYNVMEAPDGQEALRMIEESRPDILLVDIGMPVLGGFAVMRKIRENPNLATLMVLAVTAYAMQGDRENVFDAGFDGYLSKPINARDLANELERLLHKRQDQNAASNQSAEANASGTESPLQEATARRSIS